MHLQANNFLIPFSRRRLSRLFLYKRNESHLSHKPSDTKGKEWRIDEKKNQASLSCARAISSTRKLRVLPRAWPTLTSYLARFIAG